MHLTRREARVILQPIEDRIRECFDAAWADYQTMYRASQHIHSSRCRANIIYDHVVYHAKRLLSGVPGVEFLESRGLLLVRVQGALLLRFKKLNSALRSSNIPTLQVIAYLEQLELPGMPPAAIRLQAGYLLNGLQTAIQGVYVTCPSGSEIAWHWEIPAAEAALPDSLPLVDQPEANPIRRVRAKRASRQEKGDGISRG